MQHLRTSLLYILIGTSLMTASCNKADISYRVVGEFRMYNRLPNPVVITLVNYIEGNYKQVEIVPGDSLVVTYTGSSGFEDIDPRLYRPGLDADTTIIRFNDSLCYGEYQDMGLIMHNIDSYTYQKRGRRNYLFFFNIDSSLLHLATKCD